jgi:hypothetical protein
VKATADSGYDFVNWTQNGNVASTSASYTFTLNSNISLAANFVPVYSIAVSASPSGGGTVNGGGTFAGGSTQTVTAAANQGYAFVNWTQNGSVVSTSASFGFTLNGNVILLANFVPTYSVSVTPSPSAGGTVIGGGTFATGSTQKVTATPNTGYSFVDWTGGGTVVSASPSYTFTLTENVALIANFALVVTQFSVAVSASPSADGAVAGGGSFAAGSTQTVTATANSGYSFVNWTQNGGVVSTSTSYTFTLNGNVALVANFTSGETGAILTLPALARYIAETPNSP